jgi:hypothetical protein
MSKVALVHDYFIQMGGVEHVSEEMHQTKEFSLFGIQKIHAA